jgi:type IV pilus assembly protein PilA
MIERLSKRIRQENGQGGFTLIELLVVIVIIGILLAIAVPSYLNFKNRASDAKAQANIRAALPAVETFYGDNGTYANMDAAGALTAIDAGFPSSVTVTVTGSGTGYCLEDASNAARPFSKAGPAAPIIAGACAAS